MQAILFHFMLLMLLQYMISISGDDSWPELEKVCSRKNKQRKMKMILTYDPTLHYQGYTKVVVRVKWDDLQFSPHLKHKNGTISTGYNTGQKKGGPNGYFGIKLSTKSKKSVIHFAFNDVRNRINGSVASASRLAWPITSKNCKRAKERRWKSHGIKARATCALTVKDMKVGDEYVLVLRQDSGRQTINTKSFGGIPNKHNKFGEYDRNITGIVWVMEARKQGENETHLVGKILLEGDTREMNSLRGYDKIPDCQTCNRMYHRVTHYGPYIIEADNYQRSPSKVKGRTPRGNQYKCKQYTMYGSKNESSITYEGGPLTENPSQTRKAIKIW